MKNWHRRVQLAEETNAPFGVGAFRPGVILLIGEQASDPTTAPNQRAFCDDKGCSGWLNRLLAQHEIPEERLFWVNALNNDGSQVDLVKLDEDLQPFKVIALGKTAYEVCKRQKLNRAVVYCYHPQYWKRFRSKEEYPLISILNDMIGYVKYCEATAFTNSFLATQ